VLLAAASLTTAWRALRLIAETLLHTLQAKSKTVRKTKAKRTIIIQKIFTSQMYATEGDWFVLFDKTADMVGE
jgi:hypothetical protein